MSHNILLVDDTAANLNVLSTMLGQHGFRVRPAINGDLALKAVEKEIPDLILLDVRMPGKNGYEVCQILKSSPRTANIPVIFISALSEIDDKMMGFNVGGIDYITKPFYYEEVMARVMTQLTLQQQRRELEEQRKHMESLLRIVSHDLKNPLSVVMGFADMILQAADEPEIVKDSAQRIIRGAQFMHRLVLDLLDLGRMESELPFEFEPTSINRLLDECLSAFEPMAQRKRQTLHYSPPRQDITANMDGARLTQAINNLLGNAIKYTPDGGRVELRAEANDDEIHLQVTDSGVGISDEALPHIFEKFYRVQKTKHMDSEGTGLGLSIAAAIVERHKGSITVTSVPNQGSTFTIILPRNG
jgi:two-component system, sensor histidine kinase and response regulator